MAEGGTPTGVDAAAASDAAPGADTVADTTPLVAPARCMNATPELIEGRATGYVRCDGVYFHRTEQRDCPSKLPRQQAPNPPGPTVTCATDADCQARPNGYCQSWSHESGSGYACVYGCVKDEDCTTGQICRCGDPVGKCVRASCTTDASCRPGLLCANTGVSSCTTSFACQSPTDQCDSYPNCPKGSYCDITDTGRLCRDRPAGSDC